ncbi:MAG: type I-E CRISPR-associated protein Cas5/CasD [Alphaproteobacteria bacterium]|nr:type I-E CRISPR-associated protein Cas5/CasD [Alphaproteobacteria bacterium]
MTLVLELDAPMMAFGGVAVDADRRTEPFPTLSMLTGLIANALGYDHRDIASTQALQEGLRYAVRSRSEVRGARRMTDYDTTDLGQPFMRSEDVAWTTRHAIEERRGGTARHGTHIRSREYLLKSWTTGPAFVVALEVAGEAPAEDRVWEALLRPERPLFLGRKSCLPAGPIAKSRTRGTCVETAGDWDETTLDWLWHDEVDATPASWKPVQKLLVRDQRDWANQIHVGERRMIGCARLK